MDPKETNTVVPLSPNDAEALQPCTVADFVFQTVQRNGIVPADPGALVRLLASGATLQSVESAVEELVRDGRLIRVFVGSAEHLVVSSERVLKAPQTEPGAPESQAQQDQFQLRVAIDSANERLLLYRALMMFGVVGALLLAREYLLFFVGL